VEVIDQMIEVIKTARKRLQAVQNRQKITQISRQGFRV